MQAEFSSAARRDDGAGLDRQASLVGHPAVPARRPRFVAIASGKGGVGKTWLTVALAHALSRRRVRSLVFDADFGLANVNIQVGHLAAFDINAVLNGQVPITDCVTPLAQGGFDLLAGDGGSGSLAGLSTSTIDRLMNGLVAAELPHDIILFDLGTGVEPSSRHIAARADTVILVTTEDPTSLTDAYAVLKLLQRDRADRHAGVDARVVVNQVTDEKSGKQAHAALARAARGFLRLDPPLLGLIPRDQHVPISIRSQRLFMADFPKSTTARALRTITRRLLARPAGQSDGSGRFPPSG